jgi:hypothetical protein
MIAVSPYLLLALASSSDALTNCFFSIKNKIQSLARKAPGPPIGAVALKADVKAAP